jgi:hypothetical protein
MWGPLAAYHRSQPDFSAIACREGATRDRACQPISIAREHLILQPSKEARTVEEFCCRVFADYFEGRIYEGGGIGKEHIEQTVRLFCSAAVSNMYSG